MAIEQTFFVDDSGDTGWKTGSASCFVLAAAVGESAKEVRSLVYAIRDSLGISGELKSDKLKRGLRRRALQMIARSPISFHAIAVNKRELQKGFREYCGNPAFLYLHALDALISQIEGTAKEHFLLVLDEPVKKIPPAHLRHVIKLADPFEVSTQEDLARLPAAVPWSKGRSIYHEAKFAKSHEEPGIQASDIVAATVYRALAKGRKDELELIRPRLSTLRIEPEDVKDGQAIYWRAGLATN